MNRALVILPVVFVFLLICETATRGAKKDSSNFCSVEFRTKSESPLISEMMAHLATVDDEDTYLGANGVASWMPAFAKVKQMQSQGKKVYPADIFYLLIKDRNQESCNCKPGPLKNAMAKTGEYALGALERVFGKSVSKEAWFQQAIARDLVATKTDIVAFSAIVNRERNKLIKFLHDSVLADIRYAEIYHEIYFLVQSTEFLDKPVRAFELVSEFDKLILRNIEIQARRIQLMHDGASAINSELVETSREYDMNRTRIKELENQIGSLAQKMKHPIIQDDFLEVQILRRWQAREQMRIDSQLALADLYVQILRVNVMDQILEGLFNNLDIQPDTLAIRKIASLFESQRAHLAHPAVFGGLYDPNTWGFDFLNSGDSKNRYMGVKNIAAQWLRLWGDRISAIEARVDFNFAVVNISYSLGRFVSSNVNLRAQTGTVTNLSKRIWNSFRKAASRKGQSNFERPKLSDLNGDEKQALLQCLIAVDSLAENARGKVSKNYTIPPAYLEGLDDHSKELMTSLIKGLIKRDWYAIRDLHSLVAAYLANYRDPSTLPKELFDAFYGAKGTDLLGWSLANADHLVVNENVYDLEIAGMIQAVKLTKAGRYDEYHIDLMQHLVVWGSTAGGFYYIGRPVFEWVMSFFL